MAVNTAEITTVYNSMVADIKGTLDAEFDAKRIDSDLYAKALITILQQTMQLATSTVQQQPQVDAQVAKSTADTTFVGIQGTELTNSVTYNNKIKALDSYGDTIGTMGAGGLVISSDMWTTLFDMIFGLNPDATIPVDTEITKPPVA